MELFPNQLTVTRSRIFITYERLSVTLMVAQVCGVQRLCNYYSARLTPLPEPDSSRENNYGSVQITQYTCQLASSPSVIDSRSYQHLNDVDPTIGDCVIANQIVGLIGFQAWAVTTFQAYLGCPIYWLPGLEIQSCADASLFADGSIRWRSSYGVEELPEEYTESSAAGLCQLVETLSLHPISLPLLEKLLSSTRVSTQPDNKLAVLLYAQINGNPARLAACMDSSNGYRKINPLLRKGESEISQWADRHSIEHATVQAIQWLARTPDRFSAAQFSPLLGHEGSSTQIINLLVWSGLYGWINHLKTTLNETY